MDTYVILRRDGWRSGEELGEAAARSTAEGEKMADDVRWIRSYVLEEGHGVGTVCIYQATSPEAIRAHAAAADLPVDEIVRVVDTVIIRAVLRAGRRLRRGIMTRTRLVVAALLALRVLPLAGRAFADTNADVAQARESTERFVTRVGAAEAAGYGLFRDAAGLACIAQPGLGGMGVHYVNGGLVGDTVLDPARAEVLVYEPSSFGRMRLAALEYIVFKDAWDATHTGAADAVRNAVRLHAGTEPVRHPGVLRSPRLDLEGQSRGHVQALEPARDLRLRGGARGRVRG